MLSDSRIADVLVRRAIRTFATTHGRRALAADLRRIRNVCSRKDASAVLTLLSARFFHETIH